MRPFGAALRIGSSSSDVSFLTGGEADGLEALLGATKMFSLLVRFTIGESSSESSSSAASIARTLLLGVRSIAGDGLGDERAGVDGVEECMSETIVRCYGVEMEYNSDMEYITAKRLVCGKQCYERERVDGRP